MNTSILIALIVVVVVVGIVTMYFLLKPGTSGNIKSLMASSNRDSSMDGPLANRSGESPLLKKSVKKGRKGKPKAVTLEEKFFRAGMMDEQARRDFNRLRVIMPIVLTIAVFFGGLYISTQMGLLGAIMGVLLGLQVPFSILDRRIAARSDEILFYLPLVIEQVVIGVSSSLDIGPCLQRVIQMADERDSHNPVTELLLQAEQYAKSGVSFEEAMTEVGIMSGHTELKHTFMSLAQVAKHGGEITRQLQELADSVASQRETKIDGKIKSLELEATGPVGLVFVGFMLILMMGLGANMMNAFG